MRDKIGGKEVLGSVQVSVVGMESSDKPRDICKVDVYVSPWKYGVLQGVVVRLIMLWFGWSLGKGKKSVNPEGKESEKECFWS